MADKKIRALIVDDEPLARERIRTLLKRAPDVRVVSECGDGKRAVRAVRKHKPDLVFLDVQMPEMDGFDVLEALDPGEMPVVIFVTAYDKYALRAFDVHALDYLLKPFDRERFQSALDRAREQIGKRQNGDVNQQLLSLLADRAAGEKPMRRLVIKSGGRILFLRAEEIDWVEAAGNYLRLHVGREEHLLRETMSGLEGRLDSRKFLRIHRSTIVNLDRIKEMQASFHGEYEVRLRDGARLTLSRTYRDKLQKILDRPL